MYSYTMHTAGRIVVMCSQGALYNATIVRSWVHNITVYTHRINGCGKDMTSSAVIILQLF